MRAPTTRRPPEMQLCFGYYLHPARVQPLTKFGAESRNVFSIPLAQRRFEYSELFAVGCKRICEKIFSQLGSTHD